ncbi:MAG TPA: biotin/lipoyl-containing protein [Tepidiformaceae bacterium]
MAEKYLIRFNHDDAAFEMRKDGDRTFVRREDAEEWKDVSLERVGDSGLYVLMVDNHPMELYLERRRGGAIVTVGRHQFNCDVERWRPEPRRSMSGNHASGLITITAPMTGSLVEVRCAVGDELAAGQVALIIESMKMNNELRSPGAGIVESVAVVPGQRVQAGEVLVSIRASGARDNAS